MAKLSFFLIVLFSVSTAFANFDTFATNTIPSPRAKKGKHKSKSCYSSCNPYKISTFCRLIQLGNYKAVEKMIQEGEDIDKTSVKLTPLMYAARHNRVDIVKLLIAEGANLKIKSEDGLNALTWAKRSQAKEAYELILTALKS